MVLVLSAPYLFRLFLLLHADHFFSSFCCLPRSSCGPFANHETVFNVTAVCVDSLPSPAPSIIHYLASEAFALPLILAEM